MNESIADRRAHFADLATRALQISKDMIARADQSNIDLSQRSSTITLSRDEYLQFGMMLCNLSGAARELSELLGVGPSLCELRAIEILLENAQRDIRAAKVQAATVIARGEGSP